MVMSVGHGSGLAVISMALSTALGATPLLKRSAARPAACGPAIDVPWIQQYFAPWSKIWIAHGAVDGQVDSTRPPPASAVTWKRRSPPGAATSAVEMP